MVQRCKWCNVKNELYVKYHDTEFGVPVLDERYIFEMFILETFQTGLSWECVLNKRLDFEVAFDYFDIDKICEYDDGKIAELLDNPRLIRNKLKMKAVVNNAKIYRGIVKSFGSFDVYLKSFAGDKVIYEVGPTTSPLSDKISADLKSRGMKFVGSTTVYSFLQAIGIIYAHDENCYKYRKN